MSTLPTSSSQLTKLDWCLLPHTLRLMPSMNSSAMMKQRRNSRQGYAQRQDRRLRPFYQGPASQQCLINPI